MLEWLEASDKDELRAEREDVVYGPRMLEVCRGRGEAARLVDWDDEGPGKG